MSGEGPQRRPQLQEVARYAAAALVARALGGVAADDRLVFALQGADRALELAPIAGVSEDLPGPEDALAEGKSVLTELLLGCQAFRVGGEIALQMRPADLAAGKRQMRVGPPAVGGDDRLGVGQ